jgi:hypothetical protein
LGSPVPHGPFLRLTRRSRQSLSFSVQVSEDVRILAPGTVDLNEASRQDICVMKRLISFLLLPAVILLLPALSRAQSNCPSFAPVDVFMNFNGATPGTAATSTNLASSTEGTYSNVSANSTMLFAASQVSLPYQIPVNGGTQHACNYATQSFEVPSGAALLGSTWHISGAPTEAVASGIIILPSPDPGSGALIDLVYIDGTNYAADIDMSLGTGGYCGAYGVGIEVWNSQAGGEVSRTDPCNTSVVAGVPYWFTHRTIWVTGKTCMNGTVASPCAEMNVYSINSGQIGAQVGSTVGIALAGTGGGLSYIELGNMENGSPQSNYYFQDWGVNYTNPVWPNIPQNAVDPPSNLNATVSPAPSN